MFNPHLQVRGGGFALFRSALVRDATCLLDVDPEVVSWQCPCEPLPFVAPENFSADIFAQREGGQEWILVDDASVAGTGSMGQMAPPWTAVGPDIRNVAAAGAGLLAPIMQDLAGLPLRVLHPADIVGIRLDNAKALLRYARWQAPLGDRVRLLALLEQEGALSLIDCLSALRESREPMATVAVLVLHRFLDMELDLAPIGPDTRVIRHRD